MKLPSERTLRDYTHLFKADTGFQSEVDDMLRREVKSEAWMKYVVLILDELKVKESLVYDKYSCKVIDFVEVDDKLESTSESELSPVATHLLTIMVRGLFSWLKFPYVHFPTYSLTGDQIFTVAWEGLVLASDIHIKL